MATNTELLKNGLKDYVQSLATHNRTLNEDFKDLSSIFAALQQTYEGQAAETFKTSWMMTADWFENYIDQTTSLILFLEERITWLEQEN